MVKKIQNFDPHVYRHAALTLPLNARMLNCLDMQLQEKIIVTVLQVPPVLPLTVRIRIRIAQIFLGLQVSLAGLLHALGLSSFIALCLEIPSAFRFDFKLRVQSQIYGFRPGFAALVGLLVVLPYLCASSFASAALDTLSIPLPPQPIAVPGFFSAVQGSNVRVAVGSLSFSLDTLLAFPGSALKPGDTASARLVMKDTGSVAYQYALTTSDISGNMELCEGLVFSAFLHNIPVYTGSIMGINQTFTYDPVATDFDTLVTLSPAAATALANQTCSFNLVFTGWQKNMVDASTGFTHTETYPITVTTGTWNALGSGIVLNEVLPNPTGGSGGQKPNGEWVELYNLGSATVNISGYYLIDNAGNRISVESCRTHTGGTNIAAHGFLAVYMNAGSGCGAGNFTLDDTQGSVRLYDAADVLQDFKAYQGACSVVPTPGGSNSTVLCQPVAINKSIARLPDGVGNWLDPIPTPGKPNSEDESIMPTIEPQPPLSDIPPAKENTVSPETTTITESDDAPSQSNQLPLAPEDLTQAPIKEGVEAMVPPVESGDAGSVETGDTHE